MLPVKRVQLPIIGRISSGLRARRGERTEAAKRRKTTEEQKTLSEMAGLTVLGLDGNTQVALEGLTKAYQTTNVGCMTIDRGWQAESKRYLYPVWQDRNGDERVGGSGYRGKIIEGTRVRFMGTDEDHISQISCGTFVRRIPFSDKRFSSFLAHQVVSEDENTQAYDLSYRAQGLYAMSNMQSDVLFSDDTHLPYDRMISLVGEKSMPAGYYGFLLSGGIIRLDAQITSLDRKNIECILDLIAKHREEIADILRQDEVKNILGMMQQVLSNETRQ